MSVFKFPKTFCESLTAAVARFWWAASGKSIGIHWKSREVICTPKDQGGMGFKDFYKMNSALLAKQAWRVLNEPSSYWVSMLKGIYFPDSDFFTAKARPGASWVWQSVIHGRELILSSGHWNVGVGTDINITNHVWVASGKTVSLKEGSNLKSVNQLITPNKTWDIEIIRNHLPPQDAIEVIKTSIIWADQNDSIYWPLITNGTYTTKSEYRRILQLEAGTSHSASTSSTIPKESWNIIWDANVPQKIKHFMWKVYHKAILVNLNLFKRRIVRNPTCPICLKEEESVKHAFLLCPWTLPVWCSLHICPPPNRIGLSTVQTGLSSSCQMQQTKNS